MDAGDAVSNPRKLVTGLTDMVVVVLLDEADVFLEARQRGDYTRNGLVSGAAQDSVGAFPFPPM